MKVYLDMVGCRLNQSEIELMARQFTAAGHKLVGDPSQADLAVVNTCSVTSAAAADSRKLIRRISRAGAREVVSTGCWSTLYPEQALALPGVSRQISNAEKDELVARLLDLDPAEQGEDPIQRVNIPGKRLRTRAFIKVQDGCRHHCSFCITTVARGESCSLKPELVVREIHSAVAAGVQEAVLSGVQLGSWGLDLPGEQRLADLVQLILAETSLSRLRLSSLEPWDVNVELIEMLKDERVARHLHLPLQSGSAEILRNMARPITPPRYAALIAEVRRAAPEAAITTDILTGFPGESPELHQESLEFIRQMEFAEAHVFSFSPREGTPAAEFPDQVPHAIRKARSAQIRELVKEAARRFREGFIGEELAVLWESEDQETGTLFGLTDNYLRVEASGGSELRNTFSRVRITGVTGRGVSGRILEDLPG